MNVTRKYGVVRAIAFILKLLGWLALLAGLLVAVGVFVAASNSGPNWLQMLRSVGIIVGPLMGIIWFVQLFGFGSILSLLVDIEENTRLLAIEPPYGVTVEQP